MRDINNALTRKQRRKFIRKAVLEESGKKITDAELLQYHTVHKFRNAYEDRASFGHNLCDVGKAIYDDYKETKNGKVD